MSHRDYPHPAWIEIDVKQLKKNISSSKAKSEKAYFACPSKQTPMDMACALLEKSPKRPASIISELPISKKGSSCA